MPWRPFVASVHFWGQGAVWAGMLLGLATNDSVPSIIVLCSGFLTMFVQQVFAARNLQRNIDLAAQQHLWELEDRRLRMEEMRAQSETDMKTLALKAEASQAQLRVMIEQRAVDARRNQAELKELLADNTNKTVEAKKELKTLLTDNTVKTLEATEAAASAYQVAASVNQKIELALSDPETLSNIKAKKDS